MNEVKERIKAHEGYRLSPYHCTEGHLTGGYGHKILDGEDVPTTQEGWIALFDKDYDKAFKDRPIIGCGIIIDSQPKLLPMVLNKGGRWNKVCP